MATQQVIQLAPLLAQMPGLPVQDPNAGQQADLQNQQQLHEQQLKQNDEKHQQSLAQAMENAGLNKQEREAQIIFEQWRNYYNPVS